MNRRPILIIGDIHGYFTVLDAFIKRFAFKAGRPTLDINRFWVNGQPDGKAVKVWGNDHEGALTMQATIELA